MVVTAKQYEKSSTESTPEYNVRIQNLKSQEAATGNAGGQSITPGYLASEQTRISNQGKPGYDVFGNPAGGQTIYSDVNIRDKVIPDLNSRADKIAETGQYVDSAGNMRNADGSIADDPRERKIATIEGEVSDIDKGIDDTLRNLQATSDADTLRQIEAIQAQYTVRRQQQAEINRRMEAGTETALLLGGSSRYAVSSNGIQAAQERAGVSELAELDALEQSAIASVKAAQASQNFKLMEKELERAEGIRKEKTDKAAKLAQELADENKEFRKKQAQFTRESSIADLFGQGITEAADIQDFLNYSESGKLVGHVSLEEIEKVLKIINPPENLAGLSADLKSAKYIKDNPAEFPEMVGLGILDIKAALENKKRFELRSIGGDLAEVETDAEGRVMGTRVVAKGDESPAPTRSGALVYTAKDKSDDAKVLENSRGTDGWVDPALYQKLYQAWMGGGGIVDDFVKEFPPKLYVNPADDSLPVYLRNTSKSGEDFFGDL